MHVRFKFHLEMVLINQVIGDPIYPSDGWVYLLKICWEDNIVDMSLVTVWAIGKVLVPNHATLFWTYSRELHPVWYSPCFQGNENQQPWVVERVALLLCLPTVFYKFIRYVGFLVIDNPLCAFQPKHNNWHHNLVVAGFPKKLFR